MPPPAPQLQVPIRSGEIAEDLAAYLADSEQTQVIICFAELRRALPHRALLCRVKVRVGIKGRASSVVCLAGHPRHSSPASPASVFVLRARGGTHADTAVPGAAAPSVVGWAGGVGAVLQSETSKRCCMAVTLRTVPCPHSHHAALCTLRCSRRWRWGCPSTATAACAQRGGI